MPPSRSPHYDPDLLAVGAADTQGTVRLSDDTAADFSANALSGTTTGTGKRGLDLIAPAVHMMSPRDPGSYIDQTYKSTGAVSDTLFRGSGTSQAAAVMSGAVALRRRPAPEPSRGRAARSTSRTTGWSHRRAGHLRIAVQLRRDGAARGGEQVVVGLIVERQVLVGVRLGRQVVVQRGLVDGELERLGWSGT